ncbi:MAG: Spy/CpxP family protein refolding chaperone [Candidatus Electryonea clarkiae]|nr:Spy/CpxP family protein refolding chaperone [Candidatus Electryonea clarkiae]MDP8286520.1 Spy/CpxP family protein refolding chaperone [Candidatus Electryonea clarkiae]
MRTRTFIITLLVLLFAFSAFSQPGMEPGPKNDRRVRERIQSMKIWKLTETLELTEEQSARFFPRFREFEKEIKGIEDKIHENIEALREVVKAGNDDKIDELIARHEKLTQSMHDKNKELINNSTDILSKNQQAKLVIFQHRFPKRMREIINEMKGGYGPRPPRGERGGKRGGF